MGAGQHVLVYFCGPDGIRWRWHSVDDPPDVTFMQPQIPFPPSTSREVNTRRSHTNTHTHTYTHTWIRLHTHWRCRINTVQKEADHIFSRVLTFVINCVSLKEVLETVLHSGLIPLRASRWQYCHFNLFKLVSFASAFITPQKNLNSSATVEHCH